ncbi:hypothetical protein JOF41_004240 [Saccharothrix coeruleofusca]|uniref:nuclear transport factor 2 family protein n=1 Tax=Saccharothrix coeruleofusca TaxID=33919 RepID=UPI001AE25AFB|nr:nuclear transport factor 2 family protein [Saccharothrix coeruleofusca]MBP2338062.1 hypothetical protein [Saccharothrix coeruleofusca]
MSANSLPRRAAVTGALGAAAVAAPALAEAAPGVDDRTAVQLVVDGIDNAVDDKDWARCRRYFTDQVDVDFAALDGGPPARIPADELVGAWRRNLYAEKASFHSRTNHEITIRGDRATVRSKGYAFNRLRRPLGDDLWEVWAYYAHELVKTPEGWRCRAIAISEVLHSRGNELARTHVPS